MDNDLGLTLFDSHTHLNVAAFDEDRPATLERARRQGVREMLVVGFDMPSSAWAADLAAQEEGVYAAVGIQPHYAAETGAEDLDRLGRLAQKPGVVAIGEIGLDYYRDRAPHLEQRRLFRAQLGLARQLGLPVVLHSREAFEDLLEDLQKEGRGLAGVLHCFSGRLEQARAFVALGYHISIAGPVTYPRATKTWEVATHIPLDRLLLETDCPWLPPQSRRGHRNEPAFLVEIARRTAELRGMPVEALAQATARNARALFLRETAP